MFGTADPGPRIAFLGSFGSLRPFGAELAITAFGLACQQVKQAGTLTNEQSSESAHGARDSTYQQNTTNIGRKPVEITARRSAGSPEQPAAATENALRIQIWTALIAILLLKWLHHLSKAKWSLSNLASMLRLNLFTYRDLRKWLDDPFETPPMIPESQQLTLALA